MSIEELVELAALREEPVTVRGTQLLVREPAGIYFSDYRQTLNGDPKAGIPGDRVKAVAILIHQCVYRADGSTRAFTEEQAQKIAGGRAEVFAPVVAKIMGFMGQKKEVASEQIPDVDSSTESPDTSDALSRSSSAKSASES